MDALFGRFDAEIRVYAALVAAVSGQVVNLVGGYSVCQRLVRRASRLRHLYLAQHLLGNAPTCGLRRDASA